MKCTIPEISWHNREPVLSIDIFSVENEFYRLATGGSDTFILIWQLKTLETGSVNVEILSELTRHQKAVNVVKWSPNGHYLASGDDDANIILWHQKTDNAPLLEGENSYQENWIIHKILRGHKEDIYDLCWAPTGNHILTGSVDNTAIIWDIMKGNSEQIIKDHKSFVQGVAWDPKNQYLASLCSDRICRIFNRNGKVKARIGRGRLPLEESHPLHNKEVKYFHDDTFKTFFRRLSFSPDGSFLVVPSGCVETDDCKNAMYGTYIFTLDELKQPVAILPTQKQCSIVAKCCPIMYELRPKGPKPIIDLPYRMIIAVATDSDVILYDTQQTAPFAHLQKIHYTRLTDLTWSSDGLLLTASSTDGFVTFVTFEENELGTKYVKEESEHEESQLNISGCEELEDKEADSKIKEKAEVKPKKPSFLEQWAKQGPKRKTVDPGKVSPQPKKLKTDEVISISDSPEKQTINRLVPKRVPTVLVENKTAPEVKKIIPQRVKEEDAKTQKKRITPIRIGNTSKVITEENNTSVKDSNIPAVITNMEEAESKQENATANPNKTAILDKNETLNKSKTGTINKNETSVNICLEENETGISNKNVTENKNKTETPNKIKAATVGKNEAATPNKIKSGTLNKNETATPNKTETAVPNKKETPTVNKRGTPKLKKSINSNKKGTPKSKDIEATGKPKPKTPKPANSASKMKPDEKTNKSSSKKKPTKTSLTPKSSKMSLLQFFKPISSNSDTPKPSPPPKNELVEITNDIKKLPDEVIELASDDDEPIKVNTSGLLKKSPKPTITTEATEDTMDAPDDFCLQVEDSMDVDTVDEKATTEKENGVLHDKQLESIKKPRRIPLITLSSPKNKKKKADP